VEKKNGEPLVVTLHAKTTRNAQGSIIAYEGMVLDITERKHAAEELQQEAQVSAALARVGRELIGSLDTATLLDRLCQIITEEVVTCDCSHSLLWQPREQGYRVVASYGHSPEQTEMLRELQVSVETLSPMLARLANEEIAILDMTEMMDLPLSVLTRQFGLSRVLYVALRRGKELIGFQTAAYRTHQQSFTAQQIRILRGIGQLASLALEDARLLEELRQANRLKSDFLATMSHELRTPLNIIIGYADLLLEEKFGTLTSGQRNSLQRIRKATAGELELITTLLDVSRMEAGRLPVEEQEVRVEELVSELAAEAEELLREKPRVTSRWQVAPGLPVLYTDRAKLKVILKNLVGNAIKFTNEGHVAVTASAWNGGVEFAVSDTGIGIAPEIQAVMFGMFRQGDSSLTRRYGGVGLGLYITLQLLTLLGGTIAVESKVAQGSTFRVWLPAAGGTARQGE
jgi:signal transduction histidine kinase